jgi:hypothetical protein
MQDSFSPTVVADAAFDGFYILSHAPLNCLPPYKFTHFGIDYTMTISPASLSEISGVSLPHIHDIHQLLYQNILNFDFQFLGTPPDSSAYCPQFHIFPRFVKDDGTALPLEILHHSLVGSS